MGPVRRVVNSISEVEEYVRRRNGLYDIYISLYPLDLVIDKAFIEIDAPSLDKALRSARLLRDRLEKYGVPHVITFSGHRGFHFYVLFRPWRPPNAETAKAALMELQYALAEGISYVDTKVFGDVRRLVRLPGTLHPLTRRYCTYFLPSELDGLDAVDVVKLAEQHRVPPYRLGKLPDIMELVDVTYVESERRDFSGEPLDLPPAPIAGDVHAYLANLIRPCLAEYLRRDRDPPHELRTELVAELYWLGFTEEQVVEIIRRLNWEDFDEEITRYHVHKIFEKRLLPMSCRRLSQLVPCRKCGWHYFWLDWGESA